MGSKWILRTRSSLRLRQRSDRGLVPVDFVASSLTFGGHQESEHDVWGGNHAEQLGSVNLERIQREYK